MLTERDTLVGEKRNMKYIDTKRDTIHLVIGTMLWGGEDLRDWFGKDVIESVKYLSLDYKDWVNFTDQCHRHWILVFKSLVEVDVTVWGENRFSEGERRKGLLRVFEGQVDRYKEAFPEVLVPVFRFLAGVKVTGRG